MMWFSHCFFFQAEDGIRGGHVTGVQTCALPILALDIAMGGSTNTVLHLLAAAIEGDVDFTMDDMDRLSRVVPCLSKLAPAKIGRASCRERVKRWQSAG